MPSSIVCAVITLSVLATTPIQGGCKSRLSEEDIRRIVRDEVQEQLRERKRRQAAKRPGPTPPMGLAPSRPAAPTADADSPTGRVERLRRRVQTLERLVARFADTPGVSKERVTMMKQQLRKMRQRLALAEGKAPPHTPQAASGTLSRRDWREALSVGIRKLGTQRWEVDRRILLSVQKNPAIAGDEAEISPRKVGGKVRGLQLKGVHPKGLFAALGLKNGDTIERLNNQILTDIKQARVSYQGLTKARLVTVVVRRAGRAIVHVYTIK